MLSCEINAAFLPELVLAIAILVVLMHGSFLGLSAAALDTYFDAEYGSVNVKNFILMYHIPGNGLHPYVHIFQYIVLVLSRPQLDELSELQEVRNALNREEKVAEVKARIKEGVQEENLALINKALEMALELGCQEDSQVVAAQAVQRRLTAAEEARSKTKSTKRALTLKMQSKSGVTRWVRWRLGSASYSCVFTFVAFSIFMPYLVLFHPFLSHLSHCSPTPL